MSEDEETSIIKSRKGDNKGTKIGYLDNILRSQRESGEVVAYKLSKEEMENYLKSRNMAKSYKNKLTNNI